LTTGFAFDFKPLTRLLLVNMKKWVVHKNMFFHSANLAAILSLGADAGNAKNSCRQSKCLRTGISMLKQWAVIKH
jgi:hypothetical protein